MKKNPVATVQLSAKKVLTSKYTWIIIVAFGLLFCAALAVMSQVVPFLMSKGFAQGEAVGLMAGTALIGILGSIIFGFIDQKWGVKIATIIYMILVVVTSLLIALVADKFVISACLMVIFLLNGAPGNLLPSYVINKFGPNSFSAVFKFVMPLVSILRSMSYYLVATILKTSGNNFLMSGYISSCKEAGNN